MTRKIKAAVTAAALTFTSVTAAKAALVETVLPTNTYITLGEYDWAWAYLLPANQGVDLSYQSQFGWRIPTAQELASAPLATNFMFAGANVPRGGVDPISGAFFSATNPTLTGSAACATPYFSSSYTHCNWQDGNGQPYQPWAGLPGAESFADQLVIRTAAVPGPLGGVDLSGLLAIGGFVWARRRKAAAA